MKLVVIELWLGNYRTVALFTPFYQGNRFVNSISVLNFKGVYSVNTSSSVKYNKTLKALPLGLYESMQLLVSLLTNIAALSFAIPYRGKVGELTRFEHLAK